MILNFKKQLKEVNKTILIKKMVMARNIWLVVARNIKIHFNQCNQVNQLK